MLCKTENWGCRNSTLDNCGNVVCDKTYSREAVLSELHGQINADDAHPAIKANYSDFDIMVILSRVTKTAAGCDGIPYWVYSATELSHVLSCLFNLSINEDVVRQSRKQAIITPVPKTKPVSSVSE